jgi:RsiW-degrading membrane proteinase PrsW (M82 family)
MMPISVRCPACGRGHKAPDRAAGRALKCLACGEGMIVPSPEIDPAATLLGTEHVESSPPRETDDDSSPLSYEEPPPRPASPPRPTKPKPDIASLPPLTTNEPPLWRRHLHWLLVLAMIPLVVSLLVKSHDADLVERFEETLRDAPPDVRIRIQAAVESKEGMDLDDLINIFPEHKLKGAWLTRNSYAHWVMALGATVLYLVFFMFLASDGSAKPIHVLAVGLFTATVGIGVLLLVQLIASATDGRIVIGKGLFIIVFFIFKFIAFSYNAAMDPENGFLLSFIGFTFGVGLCEELVKTVPLFRHRSTEEGRTWRGLFIWGLASGAGFGIAEGLLYSGRYYNGISGPGIYVVRFISCVALHAIWSGSVAITLYLRRDLFDRAEHWRDWIAPTLVVIAVPMVLHGLYDTSLKRDMNWLALVVAAASFGWLAFLSSRLYGSDDVEANQAMLDEYKRRRKIMR